MNNRKRMNGSSKNIVITGFMGTGKTSVGRQVAIISGKEFYDTDSLIVQKAGMSINDIFAIRGEPYFRRLESEVVRELGRIKNSVISTGGGTLINMANRRLLKKNGIVFCLKAGPRVIINRLARHHDRPLLAAKTLEEITRLLKEREAIYSRFKYRINTSYRTESEVALQIIGKFNILVRA